MTLGEDGNCFSDDPGVASTNREDHYNWAKDQDAAQLEANLKSKIELLYNCSSVSDDAFAHAFADFSVIIANLVQNANCFNDDRGAISTDRAAHYNWAKTKSRQELFQNLQWKMTAGLKCLGSTEQKRFFTELSVPIAQTSLINSTNTDNNRISSRMKTEDQANEERQYVFAVTVVNAETNEPIAGAKVSANRVARRLTGEPVLESVKDAAETNGYGEAYFRFKYLGEYAIKVEHNDFVADEKWVSTARTSTNMPVRFSLKKPASNKKVVIVNLTAEDNKLPVEGARISLQESFWVIFNGYTDKDGNALITVTEGKNFEVQISHSQFKLYITTLRLNDEQKEYTLTHQMKRKTSVGDNREVEEERTLVVGVYSKDKSGNAVPVANAKLTFPDGQIKYTDANGRSEVVHKFEPEKEIQVNVEAANYKSQSVSHRILLIDEPFKDKLRDVLSVTLESTQGTGGDFSQWTGTYVDDSKRISVTISAGKDGQFSGSYNYDFPSAYHNFAKGNGNFSNCVIEANKDKPEFDVSCSCSGTHEEGGQTTTTSGKMLVTLILLTARREGSRFVEWTGLFDGIKVIHHVEITKIPAGTLRRVKF